MVSWVQILDTVRTRKLQNRKTTLKRPLSVFVVVLLIKYSGSVCTARCLKCTLDCLKTKLGPKSRLPIRFLNLTEAFFLREKKNMQDLNTFLQGDTAEQFKGIFLKNGIQMEDDISCVFPTLSFINHSCTPSAGGYSGYQKLVE